MVDWNSIPEMTRDLWAAKYLCCLCLGAIVVDFAHSARFDWNLLTDRQKSARLRWPQVCYLFVKLAYFPYWAVTFAVGDAIIPMDCSRAMLASEVLMGVITCFCSALLAFRTLCVWEQQCGKPVSQKDPCCNRFNALLH